MSGYRFSIDLPVTSRWENVALLRSSVQSCFSAVFRDVDGRNAISMVTGELLENAVKYGAWDQSGTFRLRVVGEPGSATVVVENPIATDSANLTLLLGAIRWIDGFADVSEAYRAKLLQIAAAPAPNSSGGLGLVRVCYEGNCKLSADVEDGVVRVAARLRF